MSKDINEVCGQQIELLRSRFRSTPIVFLSVESNIVDGRVFVCRVGVRVVRFWFGLENLTCFLCREVVNEYLHETDFSRWCQGIVNGLSRDEAGRLVQRGA